MEPLKNLFAGRNLDPGIVNLLAAAMGVAAVLLIAVIAHFVTRRIILRLVTLAVKRSRLTWDDYLLERKVFKRLAHLAPAVVIHETAPLVLADFPTAAGMVVTASVVYMVAVMLLVVDAFLNGVLDIYDTFAISRRVPIKMFVQVVKVILFVLGGIFIVSRLAGQSPLVFFSGLGAFTAVLILVFKDTILGLVAGIQILTNNLVRVGDWIEMPKFGVDGDVIDVSLTTVKVQNWDKTISTIPAYSLISDSFRNWRGMSESGGRRIKRSVVLDMNSIRFLDDELHEQLKKIQLLKDYLGQKEAEVRQFNQERGVDENQLINGRRLTNVGTFRAYLVAYLKSLPHIHPELTFLVRQLPPTPDGLPLEIYVFSSDQRWVEYEAIQADIFDHVLASLSAFDLRVFQKPSGLDVRALAGRA